MAGNTPRHRTKLLCSENAPTNSEIILLVLVPVLVLRARTLVAMVAKRATRRICDYPADNPEKKKYTKMMYMT